MIIEDTGQKIGQHELKHECFEILGESIRRCKLPYGDYILPPKISVDTKKNISELAMDLASEHKRFRQECQYAQDAGATLYILVETETDIRSVDELPKWSNPRASVSEKAVTGEWMMKTVKTMNHRYGVRFMFCDPVQSSEMILRILNGEFEDGNDT